MAGAASTSSGRAVCGAGPGQEQSPDGRDGRPGWSPAGSGRLAEGPAAVGVRLTAVATPSPERLSVRLPRTRRSLLLAGAVAFPLIVLGVVAAGPASAHVVVTSPDGTPGGYGKLVFRVPTESASARTVKVTVSLPADTPFGDVSVQMQPGWRVTTTERKLAKPVTTDDGFTLDKAVATVTWTAADGGIPPEQFDEFALSVGPFPAKAGQTLTFDTLQTYSDGSVVRWDQATQPGKAEPDHPAPSLTLGAAGAPAASGSTGSTGSTGSPASTGSTPSTGSGVAPAVATTPLTATTATDDATRYAAIGGLAIAVVALLLAAGAFVRARR